MPERQIGELPSGTYRGTVHGLFRCLNLIWQGKVFTGSTVKNRILGLRLIDGDVTREGGQVVIRYPWFGLEDRLESRADGSWDGSMALFGVFVVQFTLTKERA